MRDPRMFRRTMLWMLGALFFLSSTVSAQITLKIAYPEFPPFHWTDENGELTGFFYEIITEALQNRLGMKIVWTEYPWRRCQENVKSGKADAMITVPTAERAAYTVTHTNPFYQKPVNIFTYSGHPRIQELQEIKTIADLKTGGFTVITYSGNGWHKENVQPFGIKTYETPSLENVWKMLAGKRGDVVIEWPSGAWPDMMRAGVSHKIVDTFVTISSMPFHLLVRKDYPHANFLSELDQTMIKMKEEGTVTSIFSKFSL